MIEFTLNGKTVSSSAPAGTPLLWIVRDEFKLTGTKFGCGIGQCGACTVHLNGKAIRSCQMPLAAASGTEITTIEGLAAGGKHPLQIAWLSEQVPQCGYCQSGQIMQAAQLLEEKPNPSEEEIVKHMNGNLCRCMAYSRIKSAIKTAAEER
jgi:isoquinoline 1-oxidoreductase alpha subunit